MLDPKKLAIVIPLFNDAERIERAVRCAGACTLPEGFSREIWVVDDGSTDGGPARVAHLAETLNGVHLLRTPRNGGPAAARNFALERSEAAWFTPLDSDDLMRPDRLCTLINLAQTRGASWIGDNLILSDEATPEVCRRLLWPDKPAGDIVLSAETFIRRCYAVEVPRTELGYLKPLIDRRGLAAPRRPYRDELRFGEDYELYARMLLDGARALLVDPCGYYLVQRPGSASRTQQGEDHRRLMAVHEAFLARPGLSPGTREALLGFQAVSRREWVRWTLMAARRRRAPWQALSVLARAPAETLSALAAKFRA
jgi:glycosyltransferase involved in cell wall biosynthesis